MKHLAIMHKDQGNNCLKQGFVDEAIMHYTKSITFDPTNAIVFTNRATAFKKHLEFDLMMSDSQKAIELDQSYFKAYLRHGEACIEVGKQVKQTDISLIDRGIKHL